MFRGLLQPVLARTFGAIGAVILAALPFAMMHGPQYGWSWRHVLLIAFAGAAFGWHRWRTDSTGAAVVMHAGYNAILFTLFIAGKWAGNRLPRMLEGSW
jgi:membrane protease YdiL (CAAX protease family)